MPRLKVFRDHIGFYDTIVAAPSQKAALAAWGAKPSEFAHGFAAVTKEKDAVEAALANPGIVLKRTFGSRGGFKPDPDPPKAPRVSAQQKKAAADAERARKTKEAAAARLAAKEAKAARDAELAAIENEEAELRQRRAAVKAKFSRMKQSGISARAGR
jgi:colicin import membrane protein